MAFTSETAICALGFSTSPSATTVRLRQISRSPFSGLVITSKFSSVSYCACRAWLKTSSNTPIIVLLSMFFSSLNSAKLLIRFRLSMLRYLIFIILIRLLEIQVLLRIFHLGEGVAFDHLHQL